MANLAIKLKNLPQAPGVYLFKNNRGEVLYVGKAKNLKNRVRSYFQNGRDFEARLTVMKQNIADLDYTVVSSEIESLMLENNLIKQYQPRFNVLMRDDKNYQFIKLDYSFEIPQIYTVRQVPLLVRRGQGRLTPSPPASQARALRAGSSPPHLPDFVWAKSRRAGEGEKLSRYFGPYTSSLAVKQTLHLLKSIFHLCRNKKIITKPCFAYQLGRCSGVCVGKVSLPEYLETFKQVEGFLKHRQTEMMKILRGEMTTAATRHKFERAAMIRDTIRSLEYMWQKQKIVTARNENHDYLGLFKLATQAVVCLFVVRGGRLIHTEHFELVHDNSSSPEIMERFITQYYEQTSDIPQELILSEELPRVPLLEKFLTRLTGQRITLIVPHRGKKSGLLKLAAENARLYHERQMPDFQKEKPKQTLHALSRFLELPKIPMRIEGYDISNIQGINPVGSMVVFTAGVPDKSQYRKFKIRLPETPNDFAMMREMLERRFRHLPLMRGRMGGGRGANTPTTFPPPPHEEGDNTSWLLPDLIIIDGGKGQLNAAVSILKHNDLKIPVIALAKRLEEIFLPGRKNPLVLPPGNRALFLLQRIRDEAHRFAVTFFRSRHRRAQIYSRLEDIFGVGPVTRKKLIKKFGSAIAVRRASLDALTAEIGPRLAKNIKEQLPPYQAKP